MCLSITQILDQHGWLIFKPQIIFHLPLLHITSQTTKMETSSLVTEQKCVVLFKMKMFRSVQFFVVVSNTDEKQGKKNENENKMKNADL